MKASSTSNFIPGAAGLRDCMTYHGPMRPRVTRRVCGVFIIVHLPHGSIAESFNVPQNGQTWRALGVLLAPVRGASLTLLIYTVPWMNLRSSIV
jgi:hypothetical protein